MTIVGLHDVVKVSISASLKSFFADHVHWRTGVHNKLFPQVSTLMQRWHLFSRDEKNAALSCSFNLNTLLTSFHAASRAPNSCHSVSSCERSSNFGPLGLRSWGSPSQIYPSEGYWSRILVWRAIAFLNFTRWIVFGMSVLFRRIDFGGVMSWKTQPNCRASDNWRFNELRPNFLSLLLKGFPVRSWQASETDSLSRQFPSFKKATALLSLFDLDLLSAVHQPDGVRMSTSRQTDNHSWSCRTSILEGATFHRMSYCKFLWGNPYKAIETFYHWDFYLWDFGFTMISLIRLHERIRRRIWRWTFSTLIHIVAETAFVSSHTLPVGFPLQTISKNSLYTLFCSLILDHGVLLKISASGPKILISNFLFDTSLHHGFQSVIIRS